MHIWARRSDITRLRRPPPSSLTMLIVPHRTHRKRDMAEPPCPTMIADYFIARTGGGLTPLQVIKLTYSPRVLSCAP